ncbi:F-box only protein 36a [Mastacembelus armatus]|uniref:F-box only protein 36a n=1 Tax=Mastacembelus armatus TaxID=205130 RepID=UPI000E46417B|nr:F-box only protein 36 [Mastacembelus armatus]
MALLNFCVQNGDLARGQLFLICGQGPPPLKDFFQLVITKDEVIWKSWKIPLRVDCRGAPPKELKTSHQDFLHHKMLHNELGAVFGERILEYTISLCQGEFDYLERLPNDIMLKIMSYLQLKDAALLAQVSHRFRKLCNSETFWEQTVRNRCAGFTSDMEDIANVMGWRDTFFTFFHNSGSKEQQ